MNERKVHHATASMALVNFLSDLQMLHDRRILDTDSRNIERDIIGTCLVNLNCLQTAIRQGTYPNPSAVYQKDSNA